MNFAVDKTTKKATFVVDMNDENDRLVAISWLQALKPCTQRDQFEIDKAVLALGGTPETVFPGYEWIQQ